MGVLFGKTGLGTDDRATFVLGWFVGYYDSKVHLILVNLWLLLSLPVSQIE